MSDCRCDGSGTYVHESGGHGGADRALAICLCTNGLKIREFTKQVEIPRRTVQLRNAGTEGYARVRGYSQLSGRPTGNHRVATNSAGTRSNQPWQSHLAVLHRRDHATRRDCDG